MPGIAFDVEIAVLSVVSGAPLEIVRIDEELKIIEAKNPRGDEVFPCKLFRFINAGFDGKRYGYKIEEVLHGWNVVNLEA